MWPPLLSKKYDKATTNEYDIMKTFIDIFLESKMYEHTDTSMYFGMVFMYLLQAGEISVEYIDILEHNNITLHQQCLE